MAITFRAVGQSPGANSTSCVIVKPSGLTLGDLMIAHIVARENTTTLVTPEWWNAIRSDVAGTATAGVISGLYWKIAVQADVDAIDFTFTVTGATSNGGTITAWYGHDATTPINAQEGQGNAASATITSDGLTPTVADCMLLFFCAICDNNLVDLAYAIVTDNPASWTEPYDLPLNLTDDLGLSLGYALRPQTTATGLATTTQAASDANVGQLVAIAPAAITAVGDTVQKIWNVLQAVPDTNQYIYNIRQAVGDTSQKIWDVRQALGDTTQLIYHIRSAIGDTVQIVHNVLTTIGDTSQYIWNVLSSTTAIGDTVQAIWHTRQAIGDTVQSVWNVRATISKTSQVIWNTLTSVADTLQSIWNILNPIGQTKQALWNIRQAVGDTIQSIWNVFTPLTVIGDTIRLIWYIGIRRLNLHTDVTISQDLKMVSSTAKNLTIKTSQKEDLTLTGKIEEK